MKGIAPICDGVAKDLGGSALGDPSHKALYRNLILKSCCSCRPHPFKVMNIVPWLDSFDFKPVRHERSSKRTTSIESTLSPDWPGSIFHVTFSSSSVTLTEELASMKEYMAWSEMVDYLPPEPHSLHGTAKI